MNNKDNINIILDQNVTSEFRKEKCAAYVAQMIKDCKSEEPDKPAESKSFDLNQLKEKLLRSSS